MIQTLNLSLVGHNSKVQVTSEVSLNLPLYWKIYWNQRGQKVIVTCLKVRCSVVGALVT